jgi:hypothetical protein
LSGELDKADTKKSFAMKCHDFNQSAFTIAIFKAYICRSAGAIKAAFTGGLRFAAVRSH